MIRPMNRSKQAMKKCHHTIMHPQRIKIASEQLYDLQIIKSQILTKSSYAPAFLPRNGEKKRNEYKW